MTNRDGVLGPVFWELLYSDLATQLQGKGKELA